MSFAGKTILIFLEAGHTIGLGHATRIRGILDLLGAQHRIVVAGEGARLDAMFPDAQRLPLPAASELAALLASVVPDLILADRPALAPTWWAALDAAARSIPVVVVDDYGGQFPADLVINGTVLDEYHRYTGLREGAQVLAGAPYALVRPQFAALSWADGTERSVLVVAGGGDAARDWALWLVSGALPLANWGRVTMVVGAAFPDRPALALACAQHGVALESDIAAGRLAQLLSQSALALITGGMIVYEAVATGVPAVVYPQMDNLAAEASWFAAGGAIVNLGTGGMDAGQVAAAVDALLANRGARQAMSRRMRALGDGQGMLRAARAIAALMGVS